MSPLNTHIRTAVLILTLAQASPLIAQQPQDPPHDTSVETPSAAAAPGEKTLTGKERLAKKWMDEQRADNCKVPPEKRGAKPRPDCNEPAR